MSLEIFYTKPAKETLKGVYSYILHKFGERVADKFVVQPLALVCN